ncbi:hypothetical protein V1477_020433 [Vespula maculifrons]|uniref:Uncharacterized protein n=1 Tax=Vespula maculifrons TaxID=7453 RepID=A0ABD2ALW5_VESMC
MGTPIANAYGPRLLPLAYHRRSAFYDRTNALDTSVGNHWQPMEIRGYQGWNGRSNVDATKIRSFSSHEGCTYLYKQRVHKVMDAARYVTRLDKHVTERRSILAWPRASTFIVREQPPYSANNGSPLVLRGKREIDFTPLIYARRSSEKYEAFVKDGPFHFNPLQSGDSSHKYPGSRASVKRLGSTFNRYKKSSDSIDKYLLPTYVDNR